MMKLIVYLITFSCMTFHAFANCEYERLALGTGIEMVKSIYDTDVLQDPNNSTFASTAGKGVSGEIVCNQEIYKNLKFDFLFIEKKLNVISIIDEENSINHVDNLIKYYGDPSSKNINQLKKGTDDYRWQLQDKNIFLQIIRKNEVTRTNIKIVSNDYTKLIEKQRGDDDILH
jgi:hypothetical protein